MAFGSLRSIIRPVSRTLLSSRTTAAAFSPAIPSSSNLSPTLNLGGLLFGSIQRNTPWIPALRAIHIHSLTDIRFPKLRPSDSSRRKRATLKPPGNAGSYAWVKYVLGQPTLSNQPNERSVKQRNEKKRMIPQRTFILGRPKGEGRWSKWSYRSGSLAPKEKKCEHLWWRVVNRKKRIPRIERKMAAAARDRASPGPANKRRIPWRLQKMAAAARESISASPDPAMRRSLNIDNNIV